MTETIEIPRVQLLMVHQGLRAEERGMRMTAKAPTCLSICKKRWGMKGDRFSIRRQVEALMRQAGGFEDVLAKHALPMEAQQASIDEVHRLGTDLAYGSASDFLSAPDDDD